MNVEEELAAQYLGAKGTYKLDGSTMASVEVHLQALEEIDSVYGA